MTEKRAEIEAKVEKLEETLQKIQAELSAKEAGMENLGEDRRRVMVAALERGKRADTEKLTVQIAQLEAQVEALRIESEIAENLLAHAEEALAPFLVREKLLADAETWEKCCYEVRGLFDLRGVDWDGLKRCNLAAWERDELGLAILLTATGAAEKEIRRHGRKQQYLSGTPDHYAPFGGMYPEVWIVLRRLQQELRGSEIEAPMITAVSGKAVAQALQRPQDHSLNLLVRYGAFEEFYHEEVADQGPIDELGGVMFYYGA